MRFVWAVVAFVLAAVLIGAGIAQRTVFMGPSEIQMELPVSGSEPHILIDGEVLRANPGLQTLMVRGTGDIFVAYGRTGDMQAWLSDTSYDSVTVDKQGEPQSEVVDAQVESTSETGRSPVGSDLWLDSFSDEDALITELHIPEGMSLLVSRDGVEAAPSDILVTWPVKTTTPWAGPLIVGGALMLLIGLVLYILGIRHQQRGKGPRRKGPGPLPPTEPIDLAVDSAPERDSLEPAPDDAGEEKASDGEGQRARGRAKRRFAIAVPALALTAALATGCSPDSWPQFDASATPTPTPTVLSPENQKPPAVTEAQAARILKDISATIQKADQELDLDLAKTRMEGAVLGARRTDYALRAKIADRPISAPLVTDEVEVVLPQATDSWPRTAMMLTKSSTDEKVPPVIFTMTQSDPWANYHITTMSDMKAAAELPKLAPAWLGTAMVPPDSSFLVMPPNEVATAFSSLVDSGTKSPYVGMFDDATMKQVEEVQAARKSVLDAMKKNDADKTSKIANDMMPTAYPPISLATLDSGAIVSVSVNDTETVRPTTKDAVIKFDSNPEAKALTGATKSAKGVKTTFQMQLFFAVPAQGSSEQIQLLAMHQDYLKVEVIK